jgi:hypothetical protein
MTIKIDVILLITLIIIIIIPSTLITMVVLSYFSTHHELKRFKFFLVTSKYFLNKWVIILLIVYIYKHVVWGATMDQTEWSATTVLSWWNSE